MVILLGVVKKLLKRDNLILKEMKLLAISEYQRAGAPRNVVEVRKAFFKYFIDIRSTLKASLPKGLFLARSNSLYE